MSDDYALYLLTGAGPSFDGAVADGEVVWLCPSGCMEIPCAYDAADGLYKPVEPVPAACPDCGRAFVPFAG